MNILNYRSTFFSVTSFPYTDLHLINTFSHSSSLSTSQQLFITTIVSCLFKALDPLSLLVVSSLVTLRQLEGQLAQSFR